MKAKIVLPIAALLAMPIAAQPQPYCCSSNLMTDAFTDFTNLGLSSTQQKICIEHQNRNATIAAHANSNPSPALREYETGAGEIINSMLWRATQISVAFAAAAI